MSCFFLIFSYIFFIVVLKIKFIEITLQIF